jgi:uncharacterized protein YjbJ (UPF0337 family)
MRNRGFPETRSPGTFVSAPPQQEKEQGGAVPGRSGIPGKTEASLPAGNPRSDRRNTMKSSTKDQAEGKFHNVKGKIKEIAGKVSKNPELEGEGKDEKTAGKIQEKIGEIEKVVGK